MLVISAAMLFRTDGGDVPDEETIGIGGGRDVAEWQQFTAPADLYHAADAAAVQVVVFSDYQCAACRALHRDLSELLAHSSGTVQVSARHFPLRSSGTTSLDAARIAVCAASNGQFPAVHDALLASPLTSIAEQMSRLTALAGFPEQAALETCMRSDAVASRLAADQQAKDTLKIRGTPSYLVNGRLYTGVMAPADLKRIIAQAHLISARAGRP